MPSSYLQGICVIAAPAMPFIGDDYPSAFIPQLWANESLAILEENMVMAALVHRDFENVLQSFGDVVNTRRPKEFKAIRKDRTDPITVQTPQADNIQVKLNQHMHVSFTILDIDQTKSFQDLVIEYLRPAMMPEIRKIDAVVANQVHQFHKNSAGHLGGLNGDTAEQYLLETRQKLNTNKAYVDGRNLVLGSISETALLSNRDFITADKVGDNGTAMREASLGRKFGLDIFMAQGTPYVNAGVALTKSGAVNNAAGYPAGASTLTVDGLNTAIPANSFITISGDDTPLRVVSTVGGATPTSITLNRGLTHGVADNAVILVYQGNGTVTQGYDVGFLKFLQVSDATKIQVGQAVTFGNNAGVGAVYSVIEIGDDGTSIQLDRPLEESIPQGSQINVGPAGSYNLCFHKNAIALVNRPLALPRAGIGCMAATINNGTIAMRVTMAYDPYTQGIIVTLDTLFGVAILDDKLGAIMLG